MKTFSIKQSFKDAYKTLLQKKALYFGVTFIVGIVLMILDKMSQSHSVFVGLVGFLGMVGIQFVVSVGSINFILKDIKKEPATYNDFLPTNEVLIKYLKALVRFLLVILPYVIVMVVAVIAGAGGVLGSNGTLAVVASIVFLVGLALALKCLIRYYFFGYVVVDSGASPKEALERARKISDGKMWKLLALMMVMGFLNFLGGITLVGWIFTVPLSMIAVGYVYNSLKDTSVSDTPLETHVEKESSSEQETKNEETPVSEDIQ